MYIGVSIFLIAAGAILTFATNATVSGLDLDVVGVILMAAGALGLIVDLVIWGPRRRSIPTATVVDRRRHYDDPTV